MPRMRQVSIHVYGKVQGVWFRSSTQHKATELGLVGYVMNESDGSVAMVAAGTEAAIESLIAWVHHGPELARVESVAVEELPVATALPAGFEIRRKGR